MKVIAVTCFVICFGSEDQGPAVDTFCQTYTQVVTSVSELSEVKKLPRALRDRIQGNDLDYLCRCLKWKDQSCRSQSSTGP